MKLNATERRIRRHLRVRRHVIGTAERPRVVIRKSRRHLYAEVVDDSPRQGCRVIAAATTNTKAVKAEAKNFSNRKYAKLLGAALSETARARGVTKVVFDRGGSIYHGVVEEFAKACREGGLQF